MPRVCVIVLNYFGHESTKACVDSLVHQPLDTLYLVDNSVDENQEKSIREIADRLNEDGIEFDIRVLINRKNVGFGAGINAAIRHDMDRAGGHDLYLLLNNDTVLPKNTVKVLLQEKVDRPNAALLSPRIDWAGDLMCYRGYMALIGHVTKQPSRFSTPYLTGCCLLVDARLIDKNNRLFDEEFFMYGEDILLNWQARSKGWDIYCTDKVTIFHEGTGSSTHGLFVYEYNVARGHVLLGKKLGQSRLDRFFMMAGRALYLSARAILRSIRYHNLVPLKAVMMAWTPSK